MSPDHELDGDGLNEQTKVTSVDRSAYDSPATAVAEAVATAKDCDQTDLEPLQYTVDADALDRLFDGADADELVVSFTYAGVQVRVSEHTVEIWE